MEKGKKLKSTCMALSHLNYKESLFALSVVRDTK